jgi:hypothetical protein
MSAAPRPTPRAPPWVPGPLFSAGCRHSAGVSSRLQVVRPRRCAAAGAPPGPTRRPPAPRARDQKDENDQTDPLPPAPVFIERLLPRYFAHGWQQRTARPWRPQGNAMVHSGRSTTPKRFCRPTPPTLRCRSCSSATYTSPAGAATRWRSSVRRRRSTTSPVHSVGCRGHGFAPASVSWSTSLSRTLPLVTAMPPWCMSATLVSSRDRSSRTATYGDSPPWYFPPRRDAR